MSETKKVDPSANRFPGTDQMKYYCEYHRLTVYDPWLLVDYNIHSGYYCPNTPSPANNTTHQITPPHRVPGRVGGPRDLSGDEIA